MAVQHSLELLLRLRTYGSRSGQAAPSCACLRLPALVCAKRRLHRGFLVLMVGLSSEAVPPHPALRLSFSIGLPRRNPRENL